MEKTRIEIKLTDKKRIDAKPTNKHIIGMRRIDEKAGSCRKCYYYIFKRTKFYPNAKKESGEETMPVAREEEVVLRDYCSCCHKPGEEARRDCKGCWVIDQE